MSNIVNGRLYFIKDEFFDAVGDSYLKMNKENTKRPHYYAFEDALSGLLWVIPCSSQIDKYKKIIESKEKRGKKHDHIQIIKVAGIEQAFLFQDMFPIIEKYIEHPYIKQNAFMEIRDPRKVAAIEKNAREIIRLIRHGIQFTPTQPDTIRIEKIMIEELKKENGDVNQDVAE